NTGVSALGVALATLVKMSPLTIAGFVLLTGRLRWTAMYLICLILPIMFSWWTGGGKLWRQFAASLAAKTWVSDSLDTLFARILDHKTAMVVVILCKLALLVWAAWSLKAFHRSRQHHTESGDQLVADACFAIACCCMVMLSPVIWTYHRVWLVPGLMFAWSYCSCRLFPHLLVATALAIWLPPIPGVGIVWVFASGLTLLWCIHPQRLAVTEGERAFPYLLNLFKSRFIAETDGASAT
ncbi:MAG: hypothetical protein WCP21_16445, partial [Armatimonadota bacterium]